MRNALKVAKWEVKRNLKNKSFLIGLFITPIIIALFIIVPSLFGDSEPDQVNVFINDELNIFDDLKEIVDHNEFLYWEIQKTNSSAEEMIEQLNHEENTAYFSLNEKTLEEGSVKVFMSNDMDDYFVSQLGFLEEPLRQLQLKQFGFSDDEVLMIAQGFTFQSELVEDIPADGNSEEIIESDTDMLNRIIPG